MFLFSDRGNCYFWGGSTAYGNMYQIISLDQYSSAIDQNKVSYNFSAWLGGWESQDDCASLWVNFYATNNVTLGNVTIAPVYAADRLNISELLYRQMTGMVPINTKSIKIYVGMTRYVGADDDGSVDNIAFKLQYIL